VGIQLEAQWDVFISHASEDRSDIAAPLAHTLRAYGLKVWIDQLEIPYFADRSIPPDEVKRVLINNRHISQIIVVVLGESYLQKAWPLFELERTLTLLADRRRVTRVIVIWHKVKPERVQALDRRIGKLLDLTTLTVTSNEGLDSIAAKIFQQVNVRVSLVSKKYVGWTRIDIDQSKGEVMITNSPSAGKEHDLSMDMFDFSGESLYAEDAAEPSDNRRFFKSLLFEADYPSAKPGNSFSRQFKDWLIYVQVNAGYSSRDEIERNVLYNFPVPSTDRPIRPFFATPYFTAGVLNESSVLDMKHWLSCVGDFSGRWRRMCPVDKNLEFDTFARGYVPEGQFWIP
jgi:hypothetical protein